jgi:hypothetical protein
MLEALSNSHKEVTRLVMTPEVIENHSTAYLLDLRPVFCCLVRHFDW